MEIPYVTYIETLVDLPLNNPNHFFINLPEYMKVFKDKNINIEALNIFIEEILNNDNFREYLFTGCLYPKFHLDLKNLIDRIIYSKTDYSNKEEIIKKLNDNYSKLPDYLTKPSYYTKFKINAFAKLLNKHADKTYCINEDNIKIGRLFNIINEDKYELS